MLNLRQQMREKRTLRGHDHPPDMLVMGKGVDLRMMGRIIIAENQARVDILPVVAVT